MRHLKHKRVYPDQELRCELCDPPRVFKNYQGLRGHRRMIHSTRDPIAANSGPEEVDPGVENDPVSTNTIEALKEENELLKLQVKNRQLQAQFPDTKNEAQDLMQQLGLGAFDPQVKAQAQRRAMSLGASDQGQAPNWLDKILSSPGGIQTIIEGLKGVLGVSHNNEGSGGLGILKELGIDLKSLWERGQATKADSSFKVGGISLDGCALTPDVLTSLIAFKQAEDNLTYQKTKDDGLRDGLQSIIKIVTDSGILGRLGGGLAGGAFGKNRAGRDISQEIMPRTGDPGEGIFNCPACGFENKLPADISQGTEIHCQSPDCNQSFMVEDQQARQPKAGKQRREVKFVEPEPATINCPDCGQLLDVEGKGIAEVVVCPACQKEWTITSENIAIKADEPLSESEKRSQAFLR